MKNRISALLIFVAGVVLGGAAGTFLVARHYNGMFQNWYLNGVVEQAHIAREIRTNRGAALAGRIEVSLPRYAHDVKSLFGQGEDALPALWSIRDFYEATNTPIPDDVAGLLADLPPKPAGCRAVEKPELR